MWPEARKLSLKGMVRVGAEGVGSAVGAADVAAVGGAGVPQAARMTAPVRSTAKQRSTFRSNDISAFSFFEQSIKAGLTKQDLYSHPASARASAPALELAFIW